MAVWAIRVAFIFVMFGVGWTGLTDPQQPLRGYTFILLGCSLAIAAIVVAADVFAPRKKLSLFAGAFFGLLSGIVLAYAFSFVLSPFVDQYVELATAEREAIKRFLNLLVGTVTSYLAISFVLQTKDDFRFIVPYVEFKKQTKGSRPVLLDTSALIDGRIADVAAVGLFDTELIVPRFVLGELQQVADSADRLKRGRGRRGLDVVARLQSMSGVEIVIHEASHLDVRQSPVDQLLVTLATELDARILTTDFNLNKVASVAGVDVINLNDLANAVKIEAISGETLRVRVDRPGDEPNQGVGYLKDGTLVVIENARPFVGSEIEFVVTNTLQKSAGKIIFGRVSPAHQQLPSASTDDAAHVAPPEPTVPPPRPNRGTGASRSPRRS